MLHEILLSLSGLASPIWDQLNDDAQDGISVKMYTSQPERAMLNTLAELSDLHLKVRKSVTVVSKSHPSPTCRAVVNRIATKHLRAFVNEVIQTEAAILQGDAQFVGAYRTVSLSTLVARFRPWMRPMRWLCKTMEKLNIEDSRDPSSEVTGAAMLNYLYQECNTGYNDVKEISLDLLVTAQRTWLQTLMPWILYGQLPSFGTQDFIINADLVLQSHNIPYFVTTDTAETILAIGNGLIHVKSQQNSPQITEPSGNFRKSLLQDTLEYAKSIQYPLEGNKFAKFVEKVNSDVSENVLSQLLSESLIMELLLVLQEYVLLRNGEFSNSLIKQAADAVHLKTKADLLNRPVRRAGKRDTIQISEPETAAMLNKTWSDLATLVPEHQPDDGVADKAATWLCLKTRAVATPVSTLLPCMSCLSIELPKRSPLRIFITEVDVGKYEDLSAYLLSLNRAQAHLTQLWRSSSHRRWHSRAKQPQRASSQKGYEVQRARRMRRESRDRKMRSHWINASRILLVLSEISNFLHGDVIRKSWESLRIWLQGDTSSRPASSKGPTRPTTASSSPGVSYPSDRNARKGDTSQSFKKDPRLLAQAHKRYLDTLYRAVLLDNAQYTSALRTLFNSIDHYIALFYRLQKVWEDMDLFTDERIPSAFVDLPLEEAEVLKEMERTRTTLTDELQELVDSIGQAEKQKDLNSINTQLAETTINLMGGEARGEFRPWNVRTLNPLLMKLDFVLNDKEDKFEDALLEVSDNDM